MIALALALLLLYYVYVYAYTYMLLGSHPAASGRQVANINTSTQHTATASSTPPHLRPAGGVNTYYDNTNMATWLSGEMVSWRRRRRRE
eukprot:scaffold3202_cov117-Isochrysis_galbana.AAC.10